MRFLSWLEAVRGRFTERDTATRRRAAKLPVAGQLEQLEGKSLLSVSALFVNGELNIFSDSNENITVGSAGTNQGTIVQVLSNGQPVTSVGSVPTSSVTSIVIQGGNLENSIDLSTVSPTNYPSLTAINVDGGHGSDTILGSAGIPETLLGNHGDDVITALDGGSSINGNDGNDTIISGIGNDTINGEDGDDSISSGDGNDVIIGHDGNDTIDAGAGNDDVSGGDGDDSITGGAGNDTLNGMMGADVLTGGDDPDTIFGGSGADTISGDAGDDVLAGNDGQDIITGGDDNDNLDGGDDADVMQGNDGNDTLNGMAGDDSLEGNVGNDSLAGGAGKDTLLGNAGLDTLLGQAGNDTLWGGDNFDLLDGGDGADLENAGEVPAPVTPPPPPVARLFATPTNNSSVIVELDPTTGAELNRFPAPEATNANGDGLAFNGTSLFFINGFGTSTLYELDPNTGAVLNSTVIPRPGNQRYDALAALNGLIYISDSANDDILVFDPALGGVGTVLDVNGMNPNTNLVGGLAAATNPDRLIATVANGRTIIEINPVSGLITNSFPVATPAAGSYSGVGVLDGFIFLGSSRVSTSTPLSVTSALDIFDRNGALQRTITLPYGVSAFGADDIGTIGVPLGNVGQFDIVVNLPAGLSSASSQAFASAEARWESIIRGDLPDVIVPNVGTIDDLVINVTVSAIDGPGGVLGETGIDIQRSVSFLPAMATINIDSADLATLQANGTFEDVILHEIGHALGFGTVWAQQGLIAGAGTTNPRFTGAQASAEYQRLFRTTEPNVPLENAGGLGSVDAHWRESKFGNELMSSVLTPGSNPLSRVTVSALADMGYQVDLNQADAYTPPRAGALGAAGSGGTSGTGTANANVAAMIAAASRGRFQISNKTPQIAEPINKGTPRPWVLNRSTAQPVGGNGANGSSTAPGGNGVAGGVTITGSTGATGGSTTSPKPTVSSSVALSLNSNTANATSAKPVNNSTASNPAAAVVQTTIQFGEASGSVNGQTLLGATFGFQIAGVDSLDAYFNTPIGAGPGVLQNLSDPVLEGNAAGVLTIDFASTATNISFGIARSQGNILPNAVQVTLLDSNLNVISSTPVSLQLLLGFPEGLFTYTGTTGVRRMVLDFTTVSTSIGGPRFAIDNLSFAVGAGTVLVGNGDTLLGGAGDDTLIGSSGQDLMNGGAGNDLLDAGDGNDTLLGGAGDDSLLGGGGNDSLRGQSGKDTVLGGDGDDSITSAIGDGIDSVSGGEGSDTFDFQGTSANNVFDVGQAAGVLTISIGTDTQSLSSDLELVQVSALGGNDRINIADLTAVGATELRILGGNGNDRVQAAAGAKLGNVQLRVFGEAGNDSLVGTDSAESMSGGEGNDTLIGNDGNDTLNGDAGNDSIGGGAGSDLIDGGDGLSTLDGGDGDDSLTGSIFNDVITGGAGNDTLVGLNGNDLLNGMDGNDSLAGGSGDDSLIGGAGDDTLDGGTDNDTINGNDGNDLINGFHGNDLILGGLGDDTISGGDGNDNIQADGGNDLINGGDGNDVIQANDGNDTVLGGDGNDTLRGGAGRDIVLGGDGNDYVDGQGGTDTLAGNQGDDTVIGVAGEIKENYPLDPAVLKKLL